MKQPKLTYCAIVASVIAAIYHPIRAEAANPGWKKYQNGRFGYSVNYPADKLRALREADNGDGRSFQALQGHAKVAVWASYNLDQSLGDLANEAEHGCAGDRAKYRVIRDQKIPFFMALSCLKEGNKIFYTKALKCKDVITQIEFTYPTEEESIWDFVVRGMSSSLGAGCGFD